MQLLWHTNMCSFPGSAALPSCIPDPTPEGDGNCTRVIQLHPTNVSSGMKWLTFGLTLMLIAMILDYYSFQLKIERQRLRAPDLQLWHLKKLSGALAMEVFICSLHPLPFLHSLDENVGASNPYGFFGESRWTTAMFFRVYLAFRLLRDRYPLYRKRGRLEADLSARGLPPPRFDWFLSFKATFHTSGPKWLASILIILVSSLAYCHSLAEREYQPELFHNGPGFVLYYTILLMTAGGPSVGTPCSGWGQAIGIVTCLSGVIVLALTVTVVETKLALSGKANVALQWDEFDICKVRERHAAAKYIQKLWKLNHELVDKPALRASRKFLRRRAIARSVVSVGLAEARRRRVLAQRELGWLPMDDMAEQWALSEEDRIAAAEAEQNAAAEQPRAAVGLGADGGATGAVVPPELITTLNQILAAQAELARVQESLVQVRTGLRLPACLSLPDQPFTAGCDAALWPALLCLSAKARLLLISSVRGVRVCCYCSGRATFRPGDSRTRQRAAAWLDCDRKLEQQNQRRERKQSRRRRRCAIQLPAVRGLRLTAIRLSVRVGFAPYVRVERVASTPIGIDTTTTPPS